MSERTDIPEGPADREGVLRLRGACIHAARSSGQADVYEMTGTWSDYLLKDFAARPLAMRLLVNRRALAREARALEGMAGLNAAPRLGARVDADAILIERLDGERLPHRNDNFLTPAFFDQLEAAMREMHGRGWAHGDLRRKNILVNRETLEPALIDFATAVYGGPGAGLLSRWLFRHVAQVDVVTLTKLKGAYLPDALSDEDRRVLADAPWPIRAGRFFRKKVYRPLKKRHRKELWRKLRGFFGRGE